MQTLTTIQSLRELLHTWRGQGQRLVLVPTMGNLHAGHLNLVRAAQQHGERVAVTIFVNPLQFGKNEDFATYPRTLARDSQQLAAAGVDVLFAPDIPEIYLQPMEDMTRVTVPGLSEILCGATRPGHFSGVATVVAKLFNIVQPEVAVFGEKDFQQLMIIRRMVADLCFPITIIGQATVREADGLAMSSRNQYLSPAERQTAPVLFQTLHLVRDEFIGGARDYARLEQAGRSALEKAGFRPDYFVIRRVQDLAPPAGDQAALVILTAAWLGKTRLIDNLRID